MKKILVVLLSCILCIGIVGCDKNSSKSSNVSSSKGTSDKLLSKEEIEQMYSDPSKFQGRTVELYARVFDEPERDDKGTYLQAFADPKNSSKNTLIGVGDPKLDVKKGDIIHITGKIKKKFEGENVVGGKITAPIIECEKFEKTDYAKAFSPAIKTINVNKEINQHGYVLKLNKVEVAKEETRLYVTIINNTKSKIDFYSFNSKLIQGNTQVEENDNYIANYKKIQSEIMPGVKETGIVLFKNVDPNGENLKIHFEGSSENYELKFKPFSFDAKLK